MKHFRIVKKTTINKGSEPEIIYLFQRRFLFFFYIYFKSRIVFGYDEIWKDFPAFFNEEIAKEYLYELQHPLEEYYKKHFIKKILMDDGMWYFDVTSYYKNPSRYKNRGPIYKTLEEAKDAIDRLKPIIKKKEYIY